jgi:alkanesulfonate monooxygenase SsuD/methylene tetrahydromethanopterin reductase-like flavin-dependent oxidoreductase (luciferase family)
MTGNPGEDTEAGVMHLEFGVHLPLIGWPGHAFDPRLPAEVGVRAERAGFSLVCANDHFLYGSPWLDGLVALGAAATTTSSASLMTTVALPVVRGPWALAKSLSAIDLLSDGRVIAGVGPGSSAADYQLVGVPFEERWVRFEEAVGALRAAWAPDYGPFEGRFYRAPVTSFEPRPARPGGPPIWIGSWGSDAGLRRVARLADGWLASAYNDTPTDFARQLASLRAMRADRPGGESHLPNALATAFLAFVPSAAEARSVVDLVIRSGIRRPADELAARLLIGPESLVLERLAAYAEAGVERVLVWPVRDEIAVLERFAERIMPAFP